MVFTTIKKIVGNIIFIKCCGKNYCFQHLIISKCHAISYSRKKNVTNERKTNNKKTSSPEATARLRFINKIILPFFFQEDFTIFSNIMREKVDLFCCIKRRKNRMCRVHIPTTILTDFQYSIHASMHRFTVLVIIEHN